MLFILSHYFSEFLLCLASKSYRKQVSQECQLQNIELLQTKKKLTETKQNLSETCKICKRKMNEEL